MDRLKDQVAIITGGTSGIGRACATRFLQEGAHVVITARDQEQLAAAAASLSTSDRKCAWVPADITQQDQVDALVAEAVQMHGRLDVLVNCAGKSDRGQISEVSPEQFRELIELNFLSAVRVTRAGGCLRAATPSRRRSPRRSRSSSSRSTRPRSTARRGSRPTPT